MIGTIAYQGERGAYSEQACKSAYPDLTPVACETFLEAMQMVEDDKSIYAMIPLENSTAGRVDEIYRLIPKMNLYVVGEHYEPVVHCLLGLKDAKMEDLRFVSSHPQALAQCFHNINKLNLMSLAKLDTAGSAKEIKELGDKTHSAIASKLAAEIYGLKVLKDHFEDIQGNRTRFFILSKNPEIPPYHDSESYKTSIIFQVRNIPAALYKALGGFATNGVNLLKIESYMGTTTLEGSQFHIDIQGHIKENAVQLALEELNFFVDDLRILGTYKQHRFLGD